MSAGEFNVQRGKKISVDMGKLRGAEKAQGWTFEELRRAVEIYKSKGEI